VYLSRPVPNHQEHASAVPYLTMDPLLMTPEDFIQRVARQGVQSSSNGGNDTSGIEDATDAGADTDYVVDLTATQSEWDPWQTQD